MTSIRRTAVAFVLTLAAAAAALGHGDEGALDLAALTHHAEEQADSVLDPAQRRAYRKLDRKLDGPGAKLSQGLGKVVAAAQAAVGPLASDPTLRTLVSDALDAADAALGEMPDDVSVEIGRIAKQRDRTKVEKAALAAFDIHQAARGLRNGDDETASAKGFKKAAKKYEDALALAKRLQKGQGGPLPQFKAAEAGKVYTVVGTGEGGFNGDGRESRRTMLYFVDECAFGPDGRLYILDWNNHRLRCLEADGTVSPICGSGVPGDSEGSAEDTALNHPSAMAFDTAGRIYIAAWHNHKVKVFDPNGTPRVYTIAGTTQGKGGDGGLATRARYNLLPGILRLPNGDLLTIDAGNQVIRRIELSSPQEDENVAGVTVTTGTITRFAGQEGVAGTGGDGQAAIDATLAFSKAQDADPDGRMARNPATGDVYVVSGIRHVVRRIDANGVIHRFAGTTQPGYSGDGGSALDAELNWPSDVAVGADGSVYISDANNNVIRRVLPHGTIETFAGLPDGGYSEDGGDRAAARFRRPSGIELDARGNLYVCDRYNSVIRVIAAADPGGLEVPVEPYRLPLPSRGTPPAQGAAGTIDTYAGSGVLGYNDPSNLGRDALDADLYWPQDLAVDALGEVWFSDWNNHRIRKVGADGRVRTMVGSGILGDSQGPALDARMNHPTDLAFHPGTGDLWIAGWHTDKILRYDTTGEEPSIVYMAGFARSFSGDGGKPIDAQMNLPASVKFDAAGNWYVGDEGNRRIRFVDAALDRISTIAGNGATEPLGEGGPAADAALNFPVGQSAQPGGRVCLSPDDRWLYVADTSNHLVRRIDLLDPQRTITTVAGDSTVPMADDRAGFSGDGGTATAARLNTPTDVDCDAAGNLYIVDQENHCVRRVDAGTGVITTVAGMGGVEGYTGDKGPATSARLSRPSGLFVVRSTGRIYVADTYNGVLRVIWE